MRPWHDAWQDALYGPAGFYRSAAPADHFRTSVHASPVLAQALSRLARACGLGRLVDVGSGRGELLAAVADVDPGLTLVGVDVVDRPAALTASARWVVAPGGAELPALDLSGSLVLANEWLDDVPCPVLEVDRRGRLRVVEVARDGAERLGGEPTSAQLAWARQWWPARTPGARVEVGLARDQAWAQLASRAPGSVLVAVDYDHRRAARPVDGTLTGYRGGRAVRPVPDGSCDITAHVALDSVAAGAVPDEVVLTTQRHALLALGVDGARPPLALATTDPTAYLQALSRAGEVAELLDPDGLGGFGWLVHSRGPALPSGLDIDPRCA